MDRHISSSFLFPPELPCPAVLVSVRRQRDISEDWILIHCGSADRAHTREPERNTHFRERRQTGPGPPRAIVSWSEHRTKGEKRTE